MSEKNLYIAPDNKQYRLTHDEARDMGFCPACGEFVAGSEPDDMTMAKFGICWQCLDDLVAEIEDGGHYE